MVLTVVQFQYAWEIHTYLRLAGIHYEEENALYPTSRIEGGYPYLKDDLFLVPKDLTIKYLMDNYTNIDLDFTEVERAEISSLTYLIHTVGNYLFNKRKWKDMHCLCDIIRKHYRPIIGLLSSTVLSIRTCIDVKTENKNFEQLSTLTDEEALLLLENVYGIINAKLAAQKQPDYIYGYRPSTLDVALFAHIAQINEFPQTLQHVVFSYPEIEKFYRRILDAYFVPMDMEKATSFSSNLFLKNQELLVESSNPKLCYISRKTPIQNPLEEKPKEESEEDTLQKEQEKEIKRTLKWKIALFVVMGVVGVGSAILMELNTPEKQESPEMMF